MTITYNPNSNAVTSVFSNATTIAPAISGVTAGNTLVLVVNTDGNQVGGNPAPSPPTDSNGSGWVADLTEAASASAPLVQILVYRLANANAGAHTVTLTVGTGNAYGGYALFETTKLAAPSYSALTAVSTAVSSITGPNTGTLPGSYGFVLGACSSNNSSTAVAAATPTGFTTIQNNSGTYPASTICYDIVSSNTAMNPTWTASGSMTMQAAMLFYGDGTVVEAPPVWAPQASQLDTTQIQPRIVTSPQTLMLPNYGPGKRIYVMP